MKIAVFLTVFQNEFNFLKRKILIHFLLHSKRETMYNKFKGEMNMKKQVTSNGNLFIFSYYNIKKGGVVYEKSSGNCGKCVN